MAYFPDAATIATACREGSIQFWDAGTARLIRTLPGSSRNNSSLSISPDGRRIATSGATGTVQIWDVVTVRLIRALGGHEGRINCVAFHPDGRRLTSAGWDGTVRLWDTETGELVRLFRGPRGIAVSTAHSPDGTRIASAFTDGTVRIWDPNNGREILRLRCETFEGLAGLAANILAYSPDGRRLAACKNAADRTASEVMVFDAATGRTLFTLLGHTSNVTSVAFSPDGRRLATSSFDRTVKIWETEAGQEVFTLRGQRPAACLLAWRSAPTVRIWSAAASTARRGSGTPS